MALRQAEAGTPVGEICRKLGVSEQSFYRWKNASGPSASASYASCASSGRESQTQGARSGLSASWRIVLSRLRSATSPLSLRFSSRSWRSSRNSLTPRAPKPLFQR